MENIDKSWKNLFDQYNFNIDKLYVHGNTVYPDRNNIFKV